MCDVPCIAVSCTEPVECIPGMAYKYFLKTFVSVRLAAVITGTRDGVRVTSPMFSRELQFII